MGKMKWRNLNKGLCAATFVLGTVAAAFPITTYASEEGYRVIVDDFAGHCLQMDETSAKMDQVFEQVGAYFEGEAKLEETYILIQDTLGEMQDALDQNLQENYILEDSLKELLVENGIDPIEYETYWPMFQDYLFSHICDLEYLEYYFSFMEEPDNQRDNAEEGYQILCKCHDIDRLYGFYSINYWFAEWEETQVAYVEETVLKNLSSFTDAQWENSRDMVELRMETCLNQKEEYMEEYGKMIAIYEKEMMELDKKLAELDVLK